MMKPFTVQKVLDENWETIGAMGHEPALTFDENGMLSLPLQTQTHTHTSHITAINSKCRAQMIISIHAITQHINLPKYADCFFWLANSLLNFMSGASQFKALVNCSTISFNQRIMSQRHARYYTLKQHLMQCKSMIAYSF